jgi:hypothetical protein
MIEFQVWLPQILGYCNLILDDATLRGAWVNADRSRTSVVDFDELYEQLFDDLASQAVLGEMGNLLPGEPTKQMVLSRFLGAILDVDVEVSRRPELKDAEALLRSDSWERVRDAARSVLREFGPADARSAK